MSIVGITEVFPPPPIVVKQGGRLGLKPGSSMDLLMGWNFELKANQDRATGTI